MAGYNIITGESVDRKIERERKSSRDEYAFTVDQMYADTVDKMNMFMDELRSASQEYVPSGNGPQFMSCLSFTHVMYYKIMQDIDPIDPNVDYEAIIEDYYDSKSPKGETRDGAKGSNFAKWFEGIKAEIYTKYKKSDKKDGPLLSDDEPSYPSYLDDSDPNYVVGTNTWALFNYSGPMEESPYTMVWDYCAKNINMFNNLYIQFDCPINSRTAKIAFGSIVGVADWIQNMMSASYSSTCVPDIYINTYADSLIDMQLSYNEEADPGNDEPGGGTIYNSVNPNSRSINNTKSPEGNIEDYDAESVGIHLKDLFDPTDSYSEENMSFLINNDAKSFYSMKNKYMRVPSERINSIVDGMRELAYVTLLNKQVIYLFNLLLGDDDYNQLDGVEGVLAYLHEQCFGAKELQDNEDNTYSIVDMDDEDVEGLYAFKKLSSDPFSIIPEYMMRFIHNAKDIASATTVLEVANKADKHGFYSEDWATPYFDVSSGDTP